MRPAQIRPGKTDLEIVSSAFCCRAGFVLPNGCRWKFLRDEPDTSTKKTRRRCFPRKNFRARVLSDRDFFALSSVEVL